MDDFPYFHLNQYVLILKKLDALPQYFCSVPVKDDDIQDVSYSGLINRFENYYSSQSSKHVTWGI